MQPEALIPAPLHAVFGGTGGLGGAVVRQLRRLGKRVRSISRHLPGKQDPEVDYVIADAADPAQAKGAALGAVVVFHCANAPYTDWPRAFPPLHQSILDAAASTGAKLVFGDNLYMYGPVHGSIHEQLTRAATGHKGKVRILMEQMALEAHRSGKVPVAIGRAADFYGPEVMVSMVGDRVFGAAIRDETANLLGNLEAPHSYCFVDDFARGLITLSEHEEAFGEIWHVPAAPPITTRDFVTQVYRAAGHDPKMRSAPELLVGVMARFNPMLREVTEMLYSFREPYVVDHSKFSRAFGASPTPHPEAIRITLDWFRTRNSAT